MTTLNEGTTDAGWSRIVRQDGDVTSIVCTDGEGNRHSIDVDMSRGALIVSVDTPSTPDPVRVHASPGKPFISLGQAPFPLDAAKGTRLLIATYDANPARLVATEDLPDENVMQDWRVSAGEDLPESESALWAIHDESRDDRISVTIVDPTGRLYQAACEIGEEGKISVVVVEQNSMTGILTTLSRHFGEVSFLREGQPKSARIVDAADRAKLPSTLTVERSLGTGNLSITGRLPNKIVPEGERNDPDLEIAFEVEDNCLRSLIYLPGNDEPHIVMFGDDELVLHRGTEAIHGASSWHLDGNGVTTSLYSATKLRREFDIPPANALRR